MRSASQNQKPCRQGTPVCQHSQYRKQVGAQLHFVDDDKTAQRLERRLRLIEASQAFRRFQVEVIDRPGVEKLARKRCFTALPRTHEHHNRCAIQRALDRLICCISI